MFPTDACNKERMRQRHLIRVVLLACMSCAFLAGMSSLECMSLERTRTRLGLSRLDCPPEELRPNPRAESEDSDEYTDAEKERDHVESELEDDRHDKKLRGRSSDKTEESKPKSISEFKMNTKEDSDKDIESVINVSSEVEDGGDGIPASEHGDHQERDEDTQEEADSESKREDESLISVTADDKPSDSKNTTHVASAIPAFKSSHTPRPKIAWLMSFPNSGTSYTMTMVARASTRATATNYATEVTSKGGVSLMVDPESPRGPFWAGLNSTVRNPRPLPDKFVMTKTHCGSRCTNCGPDKYIQSKEDYLMWCASGHALLPEREWGTYDMKNVERGIHLLRNPFHNIIARFHLDRRQRAASKTTDYTEWLKERPNNARGLQKWCSDMDLEDAPMDAKYLSDAPMDLTKVPCHGEFYKYTQWHNLLFQSLEIMPKKIPIHRVYYEDYAVDVDKTIKGILDFLELTRTEAVPEFAPKSYDGFYTSSQEEAVRDFIRWVAIDETWEAIKHYFEE